MNNVKESCSPLKNKPSKENLTPNSEFFEFEYWASAVKEQMLIHFEKQRVQVRKKG